jgi:hypothetical protein
MSHEVVAEVPLACEPEQLVETLDWFVDSLGFRMEQIFPADAPRVAVISGHGLRVTVPITSADDGLKWRFRALYPEGAASRGACVSYMGTNHTS